MVLPNNSQHALTVSFALVFSTSALAALRSLLSPLPDGSAALSPTSSAASLHLHSPPEAALWTILSGVFVLLPTLAIYAFTRAHIRRCDDRPFPRRPCMSRQQAYVAATIFVFGALAAPIVFAFAWAHQLGIRLAAAIYGCVAPPALFLYVTSGTSFPALIRRIPYDPRYVVAE